MIGSSANEILGGASEDRISDMPKDVTNMILEALPLCDAARTSVLSRKWQYRWVTTSELVFSDLFFKSLSIKYLIDLQVKNIIYKILMLHTGHIRKFTLHIPHDLPLEDDVNVWLHFLSKNGSIKELTLHCSGQPFHHLGLQLYSFLELTHLNITNCKFSYPTDFKGFPHLTSLELFSIHVNEKFGDVISACLQLVSVSIEYCYGLHNLVLRAPTVQYLCVVGNGLKTICLTGTENLTSFFANLGNEETPAGMEKLCLGDDILEFSAASGVPKRLRTSLVNLKKIFLSDVNFNNVTQIACTLCLIRSSPNLSELKIWGPYVETPARQDLDFVEDYGDDDCSFGQLKSVILAFLRDSEAEIALIKLLLAHSPLLEQMSITVAHDVGQDKSHSMCKKLMRFGRASPKAELLFFDRF